MWANKPEPTNTMVWFFLGLGPEWAKQCFSSRPICRLASFQNSCYDRSTYVCGMRLSLLTYVVYMPTCLFTPKLGRKWLSLCAWSFGAMGRALVVSLGSMLAINRHFPNPAVAICAAPWHLPSCSPPFVLVPSRCCRQQVNVNGTLCWGVPEPWNAEPCRNLLACNSSTLLSCPESNDRIGCWLFSWGNLCWRSMATEYLSIFLVTFQAQSLCKLCMPQMISI